MNKRDYLVLGLQFVVFVVYTVFVYRGGFYDGNFNGMETICGKGNVVEVNGHFNSSVIKCKSDVNESVHYNYANLGINLSGVGLE